MGGPPDGRRVVDGGGPLDGEPEAGCPWARTVDGYGEFSKICFNKCLWVQGRTDPHILSTHMTFLGWGLGVAGLRGNLETPAEGGQRIPPLSRQCAAPLTGLPPASPRPAYLQTSCEESPSAASRAASLGPGGPGAQTTTVGRGGDTEVLGRIPFSQPRPSTPGRSRGAASGAGPRWAGPERAVALGWPGRGWPPRAPGGSSGLG